VRSTYQSGPVDQSSSDYPKFLSTFAFSPDQTTPHYVHPASTSCFQCASANGTAVPAPAMCPVEGPPAAFSLRLRHGETLCFMGALRICVIDGQIECGGALLSSSQSTGEPLLSGSVCPPLALTPTADNTHELHSPPW
jgi:hypothetical protein